MAKYPDPLEYPGPLEDGIYLQYYNPGILEQIELFLRKLFHRPKYKMPCGSIQILDNLGICLDLSAETESVSEQLKGQGDG